MLLENLLELSWRLQTILTPHLYFFVDNRIHFLFNVIQKLLVKFALLVFLESLYFCLETVVLLVIFNFDPEFVGQHLRLTTVHLEDLGDIVALSELSKLAV